MGVPTLNVGYTSATTGRGYHEVHKEHVVALGERGKKRNKEKTYIPWLTIRETFRIVIS
jgi:hypothetical protein